MKVLGVDLVHEIVDNDVHLHSQGTALMTSHNHASTASRQAMHLMVNKQLGGSNLTE